MHMHGLFRFIKVHAWVIPVALGFVLKLKNLGHYSWTDPDEVIHAVVSLNLTKHWLAPTLNDWDIGPALEHWWWSRIWLHKPILPLWLSAFSIRLLGNTPFAFRLPALILDEFNIVLVYLIGRELYRKEVGLLAASMAASFPFPLALLYGGQFSDVYDVELSFWTTLSLYLLILGLVRGKSLHYIFLGAATGLGYLTKWELGLFPLGMVTFFHLLQSFVLRASANRDLRGESATRLRAEGGLLHLQIGRAWQGALKRIQARHVLLAFGVALGIIVPWIYYLATNFPEEFIREHGMVLAHLTGDVEGWARPWHFHIGSFLFYQYTRYFSIAIYAAFVAYALRLVIRRRLSDLFCLAALLGVFIPLSLAESKVPAATHMIHAIVFIMVARIFWLYRSYLGRYRLLANVVGIMLLIAPLQQTFQRAFREQYSPVPIYDYSRLIGADQRYEDSCFIFDTDILTPDNLFRIDHFQFMFYSGRCAYRLEGRALDEVVADVIDAGLEPFLITSSEREALELDMKLAQQPYYVYSLP